VDGGAKMSSRIVFSDIDGCMGEFVKPDYPDKQDLNGNMENLEMIKSKTLKFKDTLFGVCTSRSYHIADNIMEQSNHIGPSIFEGGNVIFEPEVGVYNLFEKHPKLKDSIEVVRGFVEWRKEMENFEDEIKERFKDAKVRHMKERTCMLTYEFEKNIGKDLFEFIVKNKMPAEVKDAIDKGVLKVLFCDIAIDILPNLSKGDAVSFLLEKYKIRKEDSFSIGDSSHSDLDFLNATGLAGCPNNADEELKRLVVSKEEKGFVSDKEHAEGMAEILDKVYEKWFKDE
jgi:HAD superfamily hydrolase (TIGR01484 family)